MTTLTQDTPAVGQIWYVQLVDSFGFIGELANFGEESAAFVVHAVLHKNMAEVHFMLGSVIVVPLHTDQWGLLRGAR